MLRKEITSTNAVIGERIYKDSDLFEIERIDRQTALEPNIEKQQPNFPKLGAFETYLITQRGISPRVARNYFYSVRKFVRWVNAGDPCEAEATGYYHYLQKQGYANSTIANIVYALNHYFQFLGKKIKLTPPKQHRRLPNFLTVKEAQDLVKVVPNFRDRVFPQSSYRRSAIIHVEDIQAPEMSRQARQEIVIVLMLWRRPGHLRQSAEPRKGHVFHLLEVWHVLRPELSLRPQNVATLCCRKRGGDGFVMIDLFQRHVPSDRQWLGVPVL